MSMQFVSEILEQLLFGFGYIASNNLPQLVQLLEGLSERLIDLLSLPLLLVSFRIFHLLVRQQ